CSPMTSLKTSIKTITYLSDIGCLEIQGASLIGAVIVSALAVKILTFLNNQDIGSLVALITRRGGSGGTK
ncbi:hypothetical protein FCY49_23625, partial [Escherichia coli]|nr:hypothetical protein [Escherichia coli]